MAVIKTSDLDFDNIKASLKTYLQSKTEFSDYDFEASGLNNILDVLAYNTHLNGLIANIATNEAFLNSAQLRASAVSHAETLGYYPHSKTAASATVTVTAATSDTTTTTATLPKFSTFTGTLGDTTFTFQTLEDATATNDGSGNFSFKTSDGLANLTIKEGTLKTKTFLVGESNEEQVYIIPDENLDKTTLTVDVFDTSTSSSFTHYTNIEDTVRITADSTIYIVRETPNGYFELIFGEGNVLGKSPEAGNKIQVQYLSNNGEDANSVSSFVADADVTIGSTNYTPTVATVSNSAGGDDKESIASIKRNTPLVFSSQQRLVTSEDYSAIIGQRFNQLISDIIAWGGETNEPPIYGRVYVSIKFYDGISETVQTTTKNTIQNQISDNLGVMSIDTVFEDPIDSFIEITAAFDFDPELTNLTLETTQQNVKTEISSFFTENLGKFDKPFRQSALITRIDALTPAILNSSMTVKVQSRFTPTLNTVADYTVKFPMVIAAPSQTEHVITTTDFTFGGNTCIIRNKLNDTKLEIFDKTAGAVVQDNIGSYNASSGTVTLSGFNPSAFVGSQIKVSAKPGNQQTIKPLRNFTLHLDEDLTVAKGTVDFQNTETSLTV